MRRTGVAGFLTAAVVLAGTSVALAWEHPTTFDQKIAELAKRHHVPERLIHRVIMRESRYVPHAAHAGNYGLMQIRLNTARSMGYQGTAEGLRDGNTNLTYAVPYLANAYAVAGQDEDRAVRLYASGFYYAAKRQGALARMQVADAVAQIPAVVAYAAQPVTNPISALFTAITGPRPDGMTAVATAGPAEQQVASNATVATDAAGDGASDAVDVPLPPRRPHAFSTPRFLRLAMRHDEQTAAADTGSELRKGED